MNFRYSILSNKERNTIVSSFFSEKNIATEFFITTDEINRIKKFDRHSVSLGYALQYLFLKARGISILNLHEFIPASIINHVAEQLHCNPSNLRNYWKIRATKSRHFQDICKNLSYRKFVMDDEVERLAYNIALSTGNKFIMVKKFIEELSRRKVILPTISTIEELISKAIATTDEIIYKKIYIQLQNKYNLDKLFNLEKNGISSFSRIKNTSVNISSSGVKELLELIKEINEYGNNVDLSFLSENKVQYFSTHIQRYDKFKIEKFRDNHKKYSYLAMFIYFKRKEFMDMVIEVMSNHAHAILKRGKKKTQEYNIKTQSKYKTDAEKLKVVVSNILEISNFNELKKYQDSLGELKNELDSQDDDLEEIDFLLKSYQSIDYLNDLLEIIEFDSNTKPELIKFLRQFKDHRNRKKNKTDISFFDQKWQKNIIKHGYSKKVLDMTLVYTIRDCIRSGDIFVRESKKYNSFDHYLVESTQSTCNTEALSFFNKLKEDIEIPSEFELNKDIEQDEKSIFSSRIYSYFPKISMPEIIYEVNQWTNVLEDFTDFRQDSLQKQKILVASLLADGHNLGFAKMSIASSIDEPVLRRASEFYLNYENLSRAQKTLVNYHNSLEIVNNWGSGQNSSSDGMRVPINSKTIYTDYNSHYGNRGGGIYRHVSDQYTPYYVQILEGRDSNHVLDGLLYHDTSLEIYDHSTDTAGYTEQMFALTYLLGFNFKPRIKGIERQQLYAFESFEMKDIKFKKINEKIILENYSEVMRLVESIRC